MDHDAILVPPVRPGRPQRIRGAGVPGGGGAAPPSGGRGDRWTGWAMWWACAGAAGRGRKRLLLDAHLDEIGFMVTGHRGGLSPLRPSGRGGPPDAPRPGAHRPHRSPPGWAWWPVCPPMSRAGRTWTSPSPSGSSASGCRAEPGGGGAPHPGGHPGGLPRRLLSSGGGASCAARPWTTAPASPPCCGRPELLKDTEAGCGPVYPGQHSGGGPQHRGHDRGLWPRPGLLRGGGRDPRGQPGRPQGQDLPSGQGGPSIGVGPNMHPLDGPAACSAKAEELEHALSSRR